MIHEEICTYEVCKLAKDKGFPQHIGDDAYIEENEYDDEYEVGCCYPIQFIPDYLPTITAPTQSLLQRWLREEKDVHISIIADREEDDEFIWYSNEVLKDTGWSVCSWWERPMTVRYSSYEQALEQALKFALGNLI